VDPDFPELTVPHLVSQSELNVYRETKLLASRLQGWNLLQQGDKVSYRKRQQSLSSLFSKDGELVYCNDVEGLLQELGCTHDPEEWRIFVD
jgi:hypothetical protein